MNFGAWLEGGKSIVKAQIPLRAMVQQARILDKDTDVEFKRNGAYLPPQTVRIELDDTVSNLSDSSGNSSLRKGIIFGIRGHTELDDTDIKVWDTFIMEDVEFTIISVNKHIHGAIQADFESVG